MTPYTGPIVAPKLAPALPEAAPPRPEAAARACWRPGWHGMLARTACALLITCLLAGALALSAAIDAVEARQRQAAGERLEQLLDGVEGLAGIACLSGDAELAREIARGLQRHPTVLTVAIETDGIELAWAEAADRDRPAVPAARLVRPLHAPDDPGRVVGRMLVTADDGALERAGHDEVRFFILQIIGQQLLIALTVVAVMLIFIVRPIKAMSDGLHRLDATRGERLAVPRHHARSELGRLVQDINRLTGRLAGALGQERALRREKELEEQKYHAIFENAETGIFIAAPDGTLTSWNPAFARLMGIPLFGDGRDSLNLRHLHWREPERITELTLHCWLNGHSLADDLTVSLDNGFWRWLNVVLAPIGANLLQGVVHDVTEHKEAEASARRLAVTDRLTGVANRLGLEEKLHRLLADPAAAHAGLTLILADFDNFRRINEGYGLSTGDAILREATLRLGGCAEAGVTLARLGGDRFALALATPPDDSLPAHVAGCLLPTLAKPYYVDGSPVHLHASLGIASYPRDGADLPSLLLNAELALDQAKAGGGNCCVYFDAALAKAAEQRRRLENDLRRATREQSFQLYFQPIVDLDRNCLAGAEALIRWPHPVRGLVPPDEFIALAEEIGLIDQIGLWTIEAACRQLARWHEQGLDRYLSVNVSARQIPDGLPPALLAETVKRHGIPPARLALEITESVLLDNIERTLEWIEGVRELGFRVYLDDFGTGYSSLSYLKRFPIDTLKVDRSFVRDMADDGSGRTLVEAVLAMAHSLGMTVVAEGVETNGQLDQLRALRCHYAQGYHFSPPIPAEHFDGVAAGIEAALQLPA